MAEDTTQAARQTVRIRDGGSNDLDAVISLDAEVTGLAKPEYWRRLLDENLSPEHGERFFLIAEAEGGDGAARLAGFIIGEQEKCLLLECV